MAHRILSPELGTCAPANLGGAQQRAVLALLLIEAGTPVSLARITDAVWGEHPPASHVTTLQTYVFHLREALEPGRKRGEPARVLVTDRTGYRLDTSHMTVDAQVFDGVRAGVEHLRGGRPADALRELDTALALWRGDVMGDLAVAADLPEISAFSARLLAVRSTAVEASIEARLALGQHAAIAGELAELAELAELCRRYPLRERLHGQRILALYRCGRQADACRRTAC
jgi:DNA-binding SARP family transcriptional activator